MPNKTMTSKVTITRKMQPMTGERKNTIPMEKRNMSGERTQARMIIWNEFCTLVTSVIIRVISPPVEYSSILENAKF